MLHGLHTLLNAEILSVALGFLCSQWGDNLPDHLHVSVLGKKFITTPEKKSNSQFLFISLYIESFLCPSQMQRCILHAAKYEMNLGKCMTITVKFKILMYTTGETSNSGVLWRA